MIADIGGVGAIELGWVDYVSVDQARPMLCQSHSCGKLLHIKTLTYTIILRSLTTKPYGPGEHCIAEFA